MGSVIAKQDHEDIELSSKADLVFKKLHEASFRSDHLAFAMSTRSSVVELSNFITTGRVFSTPTCALLDIMEGHFGKGQVLR